MEIHVFNRTSFFAAGDVYRTDQPDFLLMNYANQFIDCWAREGKCDATYNKFTFSEWLLENDFANKKKSKSGYSPRVLVGEYLSESFSAVCENLPKRLSVHTHVAEIINLETWQQKLVLTIKKGKQEEQETFQQALLTTGHQKNQRQNQLSTSKIDFVYPVSEKLATVGAGDTVAMKGLGLTFIDAVLALTEGRGGVFKINSLGKLAYCKSGREPKVIFPFSRTGLPMIPRKAERKGKSTEAHYFNKKKLGEIKERKPLEKWNFRADLLPLIEKEFQFSYYEILFRNKGQELCFFEDFNLVENQIDKFHQSFPNEIEFRLQQLFEPLNPTESNLHQLFLENLEQLIVEAERGTAISPLAKVASVWGKLSPLFNEIYSFGKFSADSQKLFLEKFAGHLNRISYGPPIENMRKILAVAETGLLDFRFSQSPNLKEENGKYYLSNAGNKNVVSCQWLIDARIPKTSVENDSNSLYRKMVQNNTASLFQNQNFEGSSYRTGCILLNKNGNPVNSNQEVAENITVYGTPTEGITYDNDTLSRTRNDFASCFANQVVKDLLEKNIATKTSESISI